MYLVHEGFSLFCCSRWIAHRTCEAVIHDTFLCYPLAFLPALCQYVDMVCIYCGSKTAVTNSRGSKKHASTWRRRQCRSCTTIFTTREEVDMEMSIRVADERGQLEAFSREKLLLSLHKALGHRSDAITAATALTSTITQKLVQNTSSALLTRQTIIETSTITLQNFDKAAAITYAAYHHI